MVFARRASAGVSPRVAAASSQFKPAVTHCGGSSGQKTKVRAPTGSAPHTCVYRSDNAKCESAIRKSDTAITIGIPRILNHSMAISQTMRTVRPPPADQNCWVRREPASATRRARAHARQRQALCSPRVPAAAAHVASVGLSPCLVLSLVAMPAGSLQAVTRPRLAATRPRLCGPSRDPQRQRPDTRFSVPFGNRRQHLQLQLQRLQLQHCQSQLPIATLPIADCRLPITIALAYRARHPYVGSGAAMPTGEEPHTVGSGGSPTPSTGTGTGPPA